MERQTASVCDFNQFYHSLKDWLAGYCGARENVLAKFINFNFFANILSPTISDIVYVTIHSIIAHINRKCIWFVPQIQMNSGVYDNTHNTPTTSQHHIHICLYVMRWGRWMVDIEACGGFLFSYMETFLLYFVLNLCYAVLKSTIHTPKEKNVCTASERQNRKRNHRIDSGWVLHYGEVFLF